MPTRQDKTKPTMSKQDALALVQKGETAIEYRREQALADLPPEIREALSEMEIRELVGIAPAWIPKGSVKDNPEKGDDPDWIAGHIISERYGVGQYKSTVLIMESNMGTRSIWMGSDIKLKLGEAPATGRNFIFQFQGWLRKKDNPRIANDMKLIRVIEIFPKTKPALTA